MGNDVRFRAALDDKVSSGLDKIRDKFDQVGGKGSAASLFGNVGAKAVAKGFNLIDDAASAVIGVLGDAKAAFQEDQASQEQLDAALRANVAGYTGNKDAIEDVLLARERLGFSDDEQRSSLASLVTRTHDASKALDIQRTAMDLARLRHIDLASATDLLGKAFDGNTGALKKAGIAVKDHATAEEALLAVQQAASGQAEAYANTDAGKEEAAHQRVQESLERIGEVVSKVAGFALPLLADAIVFVVDVLGNLVGAAQDLLAPLGQINDFVGSIPGPWHHAADEVDAAAQRVSDRAVTLAKTPDAIAADLRESNALSGASRIALTQPITDAMQDGHDNAVRIATKTPGDIADGIRKKRTEWQDAVDQLAKDLEHPMSAAAERMKILAELNGQQIANGLKSKDPVVRNQAEATAFILTHRFQELGGDARDYGANVTKLFAQGIRSRVDLVAAAAGAITKALSDHMRASSPTRLGPLSTMGGAGGWGEKVGRLYSEGLARTLPDVAAMLGAAPMFAPAGGGSVIFADTGAPAPARSSGAGSSPRGFTIEGVSESELINIVERKLFVRLRLAPAAT